MTQAEATKTSLGPGQQILDQNLLTQIQNMTPLSASDILKIATFYKGHDLANHLFLIALALATANQDLTSASSPVLPQKQPITPKPIPTPTLKPALALRAAAANPVDEIGDQIEDFLHGNIDPEDFPHWRGFRLIITTVNIYWLPFSTSLPKFGLLIEETTSNTTDNSVSYVIGFSPDPGSLPTG